MSRGSYMTYNCSYNVLLYKIWLIRESSNQGHCVKTRSNETNCANYLPITFHSQNHGVVKRN